MTIELVGVSKDFTGRGSIAHALAMVSLRVETGQFVTLLGPSGCGKTTLLRCVAGLERPSTGRIVVGDTIVSDEAEHIFVAPEKRNLGMVFQSYALWPHMTVLQNIEYPLRMRRVKSAERSSRAREALAVVGLSSYADRYPTHMSGGQQQRVALARAFVAGPEAILFDEPLSNLDAILRVQMRAELTKLRQALHWTALYVTHDQAEALSLSDYVIVLRDGQIQQVGTPKEIYDEPANEFVASFVGRCNVLHGVLGQAASTALHQDVEDTELGRVTGLLVKGSTIANSSATVIVRPSAVHLTRDRPASHTNVFAATLVSMSYEGERFEYTLVVGNTDTVLRAVAANDLDGVRPGDEVFASVPETSCRIITTQS